MSENFDAQGSLIELLDENDNPQMFELIHALSYEDEDYVVRNGRGRRAFGQVVCPVCC